MQLLKTLNHLNLPNHSGNSPQIYECFWSVCKSTRESFVLTKGCDWPIFCTVTHKIVTLTIMLLWNTENQSYACD